MRQQLSSLTFWTVPLYVRSRQVAQAGVFLLICMSCVRSQWLFSAQVPEKLLSSAHGCYKVVPNAAVCRFKNVCVKVGSFHDKRELVYFLPHISPTNDDFPLVANISGFLDESTLLALRPFALTDRSMGLDETHNFLSVRIDRRDQYTNMEWMKRTSVLYSPFWPENWGHAVFDDLYSIWCAMEIFGLKPGEVNLYHSGFPFDDESLKRRSLKIYQQFSTKARMGRPVELRVPAKNSHNGYVCFRDLLTGTGALSMREYPFRLQAFTRLIRKRRRTRRPHRNVRPIIAFLQKTDGKHKRNIRNLGEILKAAAEAFPEARVQELYSNKLSRLSLESRLSTLSEIDILVTPGGAASFNAAFMQPGTVLVVLEVFRPSSNSSIALEPYIWDALTDVRTFYFEVSAQNMIVTAESTERPKSDPLYTDFLFRDFAEYDLPINRILQTIRSAMRHVKVSTEF